MSAFRPVFVVAGVGNATGTGAATARLFAKAGYRVALIARNPNHLKKAAEEINQSGGEAAAFPVPSYTYSSFASVFQSIKSHTWPSPATSQVRVALFNAAYGSFKTFLEVTEEDIQKSLQDNVLAGFAFSREVIQIFKENELDEKGNRGTLLFTGATASLRGNTLTSMFSAGKFGLRALSQSLAKEFGKDNIHVTHTIIDGAIMTDRASERYSADDLAKFKDNLDIRLSPESIADSYMYLANQDRSAWTWELDLRPAHEKW